MAERLSDEAIGKRLDGGEWARDGEEIVRHWKLENFAAAIAFVNQVARAAEAANHHPDIFVHGYNRVRVSLTSHAAGGLTSADFELAKRFDELA